MEKKETRGRPEKVTAAEILEELKNDSITVEELADIFKVCNATIRNKVRKLREDSEPIFFDESGYFKLDKIMNDEDVERMQKYIKWMLAVFKGIALCGKPTKPLISESKRVLKELMSREERIILSKYTLQLNKLIDYIEIEESIDDD